MLQIWRDRPIHSLPGLSLQALMLVLTCVFLAIACVVFGPAIFAFQAYEKFKAKKIKLAFAYLIGCSLSTFLFYVLLTDAGHKAFRPKSYWQSQIAEHESQLGQARYMRQLLSNQFLATERQRIAGEISPNEYVRQQLHVQESMLRVDTSILNFESQIANEKAQLSDIANSMF